MRLVDPEDVDRWLTKLRISEGQGQTKALNLASRMNLTPFSWQPAEVEGPGHLSYLLPGIEEKGGRT